MGGPALAAPVLAEKLRERHADVVRAIPGVVESREGAIHDVRVAIRRLRTLLKVSRGVFGRWHTDAVRREFAAIQRATGDLRDEEVLEETLLGASSEPEFVAWLARRAARKRKLQRVVIEQLFGESLDRAGRLLEALLAFPVRPARNVELGRFARRTVEKARRRVEAERDVPADDVAGLHELRIAYKELRYAIELLAEALPIDARAMLEPAVVFQKRLGDIHDADVALATLGRARRLPNAAREQAAQFLAEMREKRLAKYLRELDPLAHESLTHVATVQDT